jgi:hypothetical protein
MYMSQATNHSNLDTYVLGFIYLIICHRILSVTSIEKKELQRKREGLQNLADRVTSY